MIPVGTVVKAKAGRDKEGFFVVVKSEDGWAYIADGRRRKVESPKKKNPIHLTVTNTVLSHSMDTNRNIRKALRSFRED
ncbi:MAG: KOW domain-containing RNA-binding protein [Clostridia bacterium]|nr:KOW domain-containing RNA-binding protein [Clostridia bacterium]